MSRDINSFFKLKLDLFNNPVKLTPMHPPKLEFEFGYNARAISCC